MFRYGIDKLTVSKVMDIASGKLTAQLTDEGKDKINACRDHVLEMANSSKAVYGINTGFGPLCDTQITPEETSQLQVNLLITHAVGVGNPIDAKLSKIMMICKVHALSQGFSGVRLKLIERIIHFIETIDYNEEAPDENCPPNYTYVERVSRIWLVHYEHGSQHSQ